MKQSKMKSQRRRPTPQKKSKKENSKEIESTTENQTDRRQYWSKQHPLLAGAETSLNKQVIPYRTVPTYHNTLPKDAWDVKYVGSFATAGVDRIYRCFDHTDD